MAALLIFTGIACEKEIHEVRVHQAPQETLSAAGAADVPAPADRL